MLKMLYPEQLQNKSLKQMLRPFCSPANRVLLDYKQLKSFIKNGLKGIYTDVKIKENIHLKQQQALNIKNLMNPTQKRIQELKQQIKSAQEDKIKTKEKIEQIENQYTEALYSQPREPNNAQIERSERVKAPVPSEVYHSQDHNVDRKSSVSYQSSKHPSQSQGQWLKNINDSLGLAPQFKIKAGLRTKQNYASQL